MIPVFLALALGTTGCSQMPPSRSNHQDSADLASSTVSSKVVIGIQSGAAPADTRPIIVTPDFRQSVAYDPGDDWLTVYDNEKNPFSAAWVITAYTYTVSFEVRAVISRGTADEFFVYGTSSEGGDIVEYWTLNDLEGSPYVRRPTVSTPLGTPAIAVALTTGFVGGAFIPPMSRTGEVRATRKEVYRGSFGGMQDAIGDPDGRFLLIVTSNGELVMLENEQSADPMFLYDSLTIPHLSSARGIYAKEHATEGRKYIVETPTLDGIARLRTMFNDSDNDGVLESYSTMDDSQWDSAGYSGSVWTDNYVVYY